MTSRSRAQSLNVRPLATLAGVAVAGFTALAGLPGSAEAATGAYATGNVNMRTCGSTRCGRITTIPAGAPVTIFGCSNGYGWCDTQYGNYRGWVSGRYLQAVAPGYSYASPLPAIGALLGVAIIGGAIANNYYYPRPYYYRPYYPWRPPYRPVKPWRPPHGGVSPGYPGPGGGVSPGYRGYNPNRGISARSGGYGGGFGRGGGSGARISGGTGGGAR